MNSKIDDVILELIKDFKKNFPDFKGLYLFGLFLDGKIHQDEDIELVAIFDDEDKLKREQIWKIVGKIEEDFDVFIDLHPLTMNEFKADADFYKEVTETGIFFNPKSF